MSHPPTDTDDARLQRRRTTSSYSHNAVFRAGTPRRGPGPALCALGGPGGPVRGRFDTPAPCLCRFAPAGAFRASYSGPPFCAVVPQRTLSKQALVPPNHDKRSCDSWAAQHAPRAALRPGARVPPSAPPCGPVPAPTPRCSGHPRRPAATCRHRTTQRAVTCRRDRPSKPPLTPLRLLG